MTDIQQTDLTFQHGGMMQVVLVINTVKLHCHICLVSYSATNESRLAESHLLKQLCPKLKDNPQKALEVATHCYSLQKVSSAVSCQLEQ